MLIVYKMLLKELFFRQLQGVFSMVLKALFCPHFSIFSIIFTKNVFFFIFQKVAEFVKFHHFGRISYFGTNLSKSLILAHFGEKSLILFTS